MKRNVLNDKFKLSSKQEQRIRMKSKHFILMFVVRKSAL